MSKDAAVLISDIHFNVSTLALATKALIAAKTTAEHLGVPLIIAGDLLDGKAIIRGECANSILSVVKTGRAHNIIVLVGNHDRLHEKAEDDSLHFLDDYCTVVRKPTKLTFLSKELYFLPYESNVTKIIQEMERIPELSTIIMHQGVLGAHMGGYWQDKTSLEREVFANYRVISGHYHRAQDIKCGQPRKNTIGLFSYIGNPFTLSFSEATDPDKGFCVLQSDGSLRHIPLSYPKHIISEQELRNLVPVNHLSGDLIWLKVSGSRSELDKVSKTKIASACKISGDFKLEKIIREDSAGEKKEEKDLTAAEVLDKLIDEQSETPNRKSRLKTVWREVLNA